MHKQRFVSILQRKNTPTTGVYNNFHWFDLITIIYLFLTALILITMTLLAYVRNNKIFIHVKVLPTCMNYFKYYHLLSIHEIITTSKTNKRWEILNFPPPVYLHWQKSTSYGLATWATSKRANLGLTDGTLIL